MAKVGISCADHLTPNVFWSNVSAISSPFHPLLRGNAIIVRAWLLRPETLQARAHHFAPECWLAGFTETGEKDGLLYFTDLRRTKAMADESGDCWP